MKVTSFAVQLLPGESGDWRLATHRELLITAPATPGTRRPMIKRIRKLRTRAEEGFMAHLSPGWGWSGPGWSGRIMLRIARPDRERCGPATSPSGSLS